MIWLGALSVGYAAASLLWAPTLNPWAVANLVGLGLAFGLGRRALDPRWWLELFVVGVYAALIAEAIYPIINLNIVGCILAMAIAVALSIELDLVAIVLVAPLLWTQSRGAIATGVLIFSIRYARQHLVWIGLLTAASVAVAFHKPFDISIAQRLGIWHDTLLHLSLWGHGWGSYQDAYTSFGTWTNMTALIAPHTYNDYLELVFDLGLGAIPAIILIVWLLAEGEGNKLVPIAFLALGLTYFPLALPPVAWPFAFSLGQLSRRYRYGSLAPHRLSLS